MRHLILGSSLLLALGCASDPAATPAPTPKPRLAPELGVGDKTAASVTLTTIIGPEARLKRPTDLDFNPRVSGELWVVNATDNSMVIVHDATSDGRTSERRNEPAMDHFMDRPTSIAFGAEPTTFGSIGTFGTCGESRNEHGSMEGNANDFMGPVLWTSDLAIFTKKDPIGLGSHIDMLHSSPLCMGITHEADNVYWVFGGQSGAIQRYDFAKDHGVGMDNHSDGSIRWYGAGQFKRVEGVPSHLAFRPQDGMVYVADTGNGRIVKLDTKSGTRTKNAPKKEELVASDFMDGASIEEVVSQSQGLVTRPSGLEIHGDYLYVSDNANGRITAFDFKGEAVNWLDTGLPDGALGGMVFGPDGKLYIVDMLGNQVLRIDPKPAAK